MDAQGSKAGAAARPGRGSESGWRTVGHVLQDLARQPHLGWLRAALDSGAAGDGSGAASASVRSTRFAA